MRIFSLIVLSALMAAPTAAQNYLGLLMNEGHTFQLGIGADPGLYAGADYLWGAGEATSHHRIGLLANASVPLFAQRGFDIDVRVGVGYLARFSSQLGVISGISWGMHRAADLNGKYLASGFKFDCMPGLYGKHWVVAPHLAVDLRPWVHLHHSEYARAAFQELYPGGTGSYQTPQDGWFRQRYAMLQLGMTTGYVQPQWSINLIAGFQHTENRLGLIAFPDIGIMPFYGSLNIGYRLP